MLQILLKFMSKKVIVSRDRLMAMKQPESVKISRYSTSTLIAGAQKKE